MGAQCITPQPMDSTQSNSPVLRVVSAVLGSKHSGFEVVEEACGLAVADCRLNWWLASAKESKGPHLSEQAWLDALDQYERIISDVSSAWQTFQSYEWPRGELEAWARRSKAFQLALENARLALDNICLANGRTNQLKVVKIPYA